MPFRVLNWIRFRSISVSRISVRALPVGRGSNKIAVTLHWACAPLRRRLSAPARIDLVVDDRKLLDRRVVVEVDVGELIRASGGSECPGDRRYAVVIEEVAVNDNIAIQAAAPDRANSAIGNPIRPSPPLPVDLVVQESGWCRWR
jgi:hypothetical protein